MDLKEVVNGFTIFEFDTSRSGFLVDLNLPVDFPAVFFRLLVGIWFVFLQRSLLAVFSEFEIELFSGLRLYGSALLHWSPIGGAMYILRKYYK